MSGKNIVEFGEVFGFDGNRETEFTLQDAGGHQFDVHVIVRPRASNGISAGDPSAIICEALLGLTGGEQADEIIAAVTGTRATS